MPFFHIATSKSGRKLLRFVHFDLQMCFSLQRHAIFHLCSTSAPAALPSLLFDPADPQAIEKTQRFATFLSRVWIFFLLTFAQLYLLSSDSTSLLCFTSSDSASLPCFLFQLSILSEVVVSVVASVISKGSWEVCLSRNLPALTSSASQMAIGGGRWTMNGGTSMRQGNEPTGVAPSLLPMRNGTEGWGEHGTSIVNHCLFFELGRLEEVASLASPSNSTCPLPQGKRNRGK